MTIITALVIGVALAAIRFLWDVFVAWPYSDRTRFLSRITWKVIRYTQTREAIHEVLLKDFPGVISDAFKRQMWFRAVLLPVAHFAAFSTISYGVLSHGYLIVAIASLAGVITGTGVGFGAHEGQMFKNYQEVAEDIIRNYQGALVGYTLVTVLYFVLSWAL